MNEERKKNENKKTKQKKEKCQKKNPKRSPLCHISHEEREFYLEQSLQIEQTTQQKQKRTKSQSDNNQQTQSKKRNYHQKMKIQDDFDYYDGNSDDFYEDKIEQRHIKKKILKIDLNNKMGSQLSCDMHTFWRELQLGQEQNRQNILGGKPTNKEYEISGSDKEIIYKSNKKSPGKEVLANYTNTRKNFIKNMQKQIMRYIDDNKKLIKFIFNKYQVSYKDFFKKFTIKTQISNNTQLIDQYFSSIDQKDSEQISASQYRMENLENDFQKDFSKDILRRFAYRFVRQEYIPYLYTMSAISNSNKELFIELKQKMIDDLTPQFKIISP